MRGGPDISRCASGWDGWKYGMVTFSEGVAKPPFWLERRVMAGPRVAPCKPPACHDEHTMKETKAERNKDIAEWRSQSGGSPETQLLKTNEMFFALDEWFALTLYFVKPFISCFFFIEYFMKYCQLNAIL